MELREAMRTTPASREHTTDDLSDDVLYDILEDARFAPNGGNRRAWRVIVIRDPAMKQKIAALYDLGMREYMGFHRAGLVPFVASNDGKPAQIDLDEARKVPLPFEHAHIATAPVLLVILLDTTAVSSVDSGMGRVPVTAGGSAFPFANNILLARAMSDSAATSRRCWLARNRPSASCSASPTSSSSPPCSRSDAPSARSRN